MMTIAPYLVQLDVKVRYYCGTNIARCNGKTASSTSRPQIAVESAAQKHFTCLCDTCGWRPEQFDRTAKELITGWQVTYTPRI